MDRPLTLDHLVIHVNDLEAAIADYTALGFTVQRGGVHADGATHNALVGFADGSYLELLAFLRASPQHRWSWAHERRWEGFIDFALLPASVAAVVAGAQARGLAYQGPIPGGRLRPDGEELRWETGTPPVPGMPFLCGDVTPRERRVREGEVRVHANGVQGIAAVTVAVRDLPESLARYQALLGIDSGAAPAPAAWPGLGLQVAVLPLGPTQLVLAAPGAAAADGAAPGHGVAGAARAALQAHLQQQGEGLMAVALHGGTGPLRPLPVPLTHGAAFEAPAG